MRRLLAIYRRELLSYFTSPVAYIILFVFLLANGVTFVFSLNLLKGQIEDILRALYGGMVFWFLVLLIPPLLTMRSFAEERRTGTFELLVTTGISESALVGGKFLASWTYFLFLWATLIPVHLMIGQVAEPEWGVIYAYHFGLASIGAVFCATGLFASTLSKNQLAAASIAMILNLLIFFLHYFRNFYQRGDLELRYFDYLSPSYHFVNDFSNGVIDLRYVVLYGSVSLLFLFLAVKALEWRRWW